MWYCVGENLRLDLQGGILLLVEVGMCMFDWTSRNSRDEGGGQHQGSARITHVVLS